MGVIQKLSDALNGRKKIAIQEVNSATYHSPLCSNAENVFAQARPLINELKMVLPYGVGRNGARLPLTRTPELAVLQSPNEEMGWAEFADLMFATWLTEKELNLHVWRNQKGVVYGYTVVPVGSRHVVGGKEYFRTTLDDGTMVDLTSDDVMTLRFSRNPRNIDQGISPGIASMIWSQIDDVIAQYQLGHFENGAVPAYITIIRASTKDKYLAKRKEMQDGFHGAHNKGKTLFLWRQMLDDGNEKDEVEVKTIQGSNASLDIKGIMSIVNDKLNKAFGVSEFILGNDSSAKYDNAELSQQQFMQHRVYPALFTFWSQFQHELDRILGGLGYAIQFDLEIPELTDRMKVKAETEKIKAETTNLNTQREKLEEEKQKLLVEQDNLRRSSSKTQLESLLSALDAGATPEAALLALDLDQNWLQAAQDIYNSKFQTTATNDNAVTNNHVCSHCKHTHDAKEPYEPIFSEDEAKEEGIYNRLVRIIESEIAKVAGEGAILTDEDIEKIKLAIVTQLLDSAEQGANYGAEQIKAFALGADAEEIANVLRDGGYTLGKGFQERLNKRVDLLVSRLAGSAQEKAREVLNAERSEPLTAAQIRRELKAVIPLWRAEMIARNETVYAFRAGHLENDKNLGQKYGLKLRKVWRCTNDDRACPICRAMDGQTVDIDSAFPDEVRDAEGVAYSWEHSNWNEDGAIPSAHVGCRCHFETEVVNE